MERTHFNPDAMKDGGSRTRSRAAGGQALLEPGSAFMEIEGTQIRDQEAGRAGGAGRTYDVIVIGAGQAGLSVSYHLSRRGIDHVVLEGRARVGDVWRQRWDSLRLFTPAKFDGLDGMPFPAHPDTFPTKDEMADYLEAYRDRFQLPVIHARVDRLERQGTKYVVSAGDRRFLARHVVVAAASYQKPKIPTFAGDLDPAIRQLHSCEYRNPGQLKDGEVLIVGAGNSGAEIAVELASRHRVMLSGRDVGYIPFRIAGFLGRKLLVRLVVRVLFHRILTVNTPIGRKVRPKFIAMGGPLIRTRGKELTAAGVTRVPRVRGVAHGYPCLEDGTVVRPANIIWCTGFHPNLDWIHVPIARDNGRPKHESGIVTDEPGLYFIGMHFQHALSSAMIHGVGRDARRTVRCICERLEQGTGGIDAPLAQQEVVN